MSIAQFIGNCISCFDDEGNCTDAKLPWETEHAFAVALLSDTIVELNEHDFSCLCDYRPSQEATEFFKMGNVYIAYNENIHKYFFYVGE